MAGANPTMTKERDPPRDLRRRQKDGAGLAGGRGRYLLRHAGAEGAQEIAGALEGRRRQPGDAGRLSGRARHAGGEPAEGILLHRPLQGLSNRADPAVEGEARGRRTAAAPPMARAGVEEGGQGIRSKPNAMTAWHD